VKPQYYILLLVAFLLVGIPALVVLRAFLRAKKLAAAARALGYTYRRGPDRALIESLFDFPFVAQNRRLPSATHIVARETDEARYTILVFSCSSGPPHRKMRRTTMAYIEATALRLPNFIVRRRRRAERETPNTREVQFADRPELMEERAIMTDDEDALRRLFTPAVLDFLAQHPRLRVEGRNGRLLCFYPVRRIEAGELAAFEAMAREAFSRFADR